MIMRFLGLFVLAALLVLAAYLVAVFEWTYASGERAGWVQKISHKGWICKTWEGELAMSSIPGSIPEKFAFTVRDSAVAELINQSAGQRVRLHYEQHRGLPGTCFGETGYWVDSLVVIQDQSPNGAPIAPTPTPAPVMPPVAGPGTPVRP
jgi:hypothetical protein